MPCVTSKANALYVKQTTRMICNTHSREYGHIKYWLGLHLGDYFPDMVGGPHLEMISAHYKHMRLLLVEAFVLGDVMVNNLKGVTTKSMYISYTTIFPQPKVVFRYDVD